MFCSKCGKTIHVDDVMCPGCGSPIGDNRFGGIPYTSAQFTIAPGQTVFGPAKREGEPAEAENEASVGQSSFGEGKDYTKTTYSGMSKPDAEDADSGTTYRPVYEGASAPEDVRRDMRAAVHGTEEEAGEEAGKEAEQKDAKDGKKDAAQGERPRLSQAAQESLDEIFGNLQPEEETDMSRFRAQPIKAEKRAGISDDVNEYIRRLREEQASKGRRARGEYADEPEAEDEREPDEEVETPTTDDFEEEPDEDYEDDNYRTVGAGQIIKIVIAVLLAAAIVVGGIFLINSIRKKTASKATIEGVTETLRTEGIALLRAHTDSAYVNSLLNVYTSDGIISMSTKLSEDAAAIDALLPEESASYDSTFIEAMQAIQTDINTAVTMDALATEDMTSEAAAESSARWESVSASIASLEACTTPAELTAIISGTRLTLVESTPEPTATPVAYTSLAKGDVSNEVLELQVRLYELGYLDDDRDGKFGTKTQTAVKTFQEKAGLNATGIADNETLTLLYSDEAPYAPGAVTPTPAPTPTPTPEPVIQPAEATDGTEDESYDESYDEEYDDTSDEEYDDELNAA